MPVQQRVHIQSSTSVNPPPLPMENFSFRVCVVVGCLSHCNFLSVQTVVKCRRRFMLRAHLREMNADPGFATRMGVQLNLLV